MIGTVIWFDPHKGFGFIHPENGEGKDIFVHHQNIKMEGFRQLLPDQKVSYEIGKNNKGPQAINVEVVK